MAMDQIEASVKQKLPALRGSSRKHLHPRLQDQIQAVKEPERHEDCCSNFCSFSCSGSFSGMEASQFKIWFSHEFSQHDPKKLVQVRWAAIPQVELIVKSRCTYSIWQRFHMDLSMFCGNLNLLVEEKASENSFHQQYLTERSYRGPKGSAPASKRPNPTSCNKTQAGLRRHDNFSSIGARQRLLIWLNAYSEACPRPLPSRCHIATYTASDQASAKKIHSRGARASGARPSSGNSAKEPHPDGLEVRVKDIVLQSPSRKPREKSRQQHSEIIHIKFRHIIGIGVDHINSYWPNDYRTSTTILVCTLDYEMPLWATFAGGGPNLALDGVNPPGVRRVDAHS
ncbi:hypothetical protein R3P38DRAFT_2806015 [Favolaschia claudopus]|uniref:Uncharacterized protein n=1 Tax=Favolaschia claudopus TaxID=2862362 RepID=A0AAV9ZLN7_9AGAR